MQFIINNWYIIFAVLAILAASWIAVYRYFKLPSEEQIEKVRNWLLWAVTEAERELGGGTGKLKLRQVYDLFVSRFPWLAPVVSFQRFAELVDDALDEMRKLLKDNRAVQAHVSGEGGTNGEAAQ